jgi:hypothetical protein
VVVVVVVFVCVWLGGEVCQGVLKESLLGGVLVVEVTLRATPGSGTDFGLCCISKFRYSRKLREDPRKHVRHRPPHANESRARLLGTSSQLFR